MLPNCPLYNFGKLPELNLAAFCKAHHVHDQPVWVIGYTYCTQYLHPDFCIPYGGITVPLGDLNKVSVLTVPRR